MEIGDFQSKGKVEQKGKIDLYLQFFAYGCK